MERISVIVPQNPFAPEVEKAQRCLSALDVDKLMEWWPGLPHHPHRDPEKVRAIQRSLDWKRVTQIAAYLLQEEITDAPDLIAKYFKKIYEPRKLDPGREWPPKVKRTVGFDHSKYPDFSNILVHINGAELEPETGKDIKGVAHLVIKSATKDLNFTVIDGQHRINGAYLALRIKREKNAKASYQLPATIYLDLDKLGEPPRHQAQIFIDVNYYQKKVDTSLVIDLFPTSRGRDAITDRERAQDIGRKLMLETGPLVGMIQIPGIRYGTKNVVTLATLVGSIERVLPHLEQAEIKGIDAQTESIAMVLEAWLEGSGRIEHPSSSEDLDTENVVYQGRILVSALSLIPAMLIHIREKGIKGLFSPDCKTVLIEWTRKLISRAGLLKHRQFIARNEFKRKGFLGSGGIGRFRDLLWAASNPRFKRGRIKAEKLAELAERERRGVDASLNQETQG